MPKIINLKDQRFERLHVIEKSYSKNHRVHWKCKCDCGNIIFPTTNDLRSKNTKSCGCYKRDKIRFMRTTSKKNKLTVEDKAKCVSLWKNGKSTGEIGEKFGVTHNSIRSILNTAGINTITDKVRYRDSGYLLKENAFDDPSDEADYWGGFLAADGYVCKENKTVSIDLKSGDISHLKKLQKFIGSKHKIYERIFKDTDKKTVSFSFTSEHICNILLDKYGIYNKKSSTYTVPNDMVHNSAYWRGMIDGDGSLYIANKKDLRVIMYGTKNVCDSFKSFVSRIGKIKTTSSKVTNSTIYSVASNRKETVKKLLDNIYKNSSIVLDRKYKIYKDFYEL